MPASTHLARAVPSYYESFQYALDSLSEQIVSRVDARRLFPTGTMGGAAMKIQGNVSLNG